MTFDFTDSLIEVFPGINDNPIPPTSSSAGNGSHLISQYNGLINKIAQTFFELAPVAHTHWHEDSIVVSGNPLNVILNSSIRHSTGALQSPPAVGDSFKFFAVLASGNYRIKIQHLGNTDCGILTVYVDGAEIGSWDFYRAQLTYNLTRTLDFTITTVGQHEFKFVVQGKNPSSSNYFINITRFHVSLVESI